MHKIMATNKKSFILYTDLIHTVNQLPDKEAGELFKHILSYVNDEAPTTESIVIKIAFEPIKQQLKRDLDKWDNTIEGRSKAGKASAEARRLKKEQTLTNPTSVESVEQTLTNPTDTVNVTVTVNDNDNEIKEKSFTEKKQIFLNWFNNNKEKHLGIKGKFKVLTSTDENNLKKLFKSYSQDEFKTAIENLYQSKWAIENNMLTPSHFLRVENFNKYLNQIIKKKKVIIEAKDYFNR